MILSAQSTINQGSDIQLFTTQIPQPRKWQLDELIHQSPKPNPHNQSDIGSNSNTSMQMTKLEKRAEIRIRRTQNQTPRS